MPRDFIDSLFIKTESQLESFILTAKYLGFSELWISNPTKKINNSINKLTKSHSVRMYKRADIGADNESKEQIIALLRQKRRSVPIIAVTCLIPEIAAWAAQDNRIDILKFPVFQIGKLLSRSTAKLMIKFDKYLEISLSELYCLPERQQIAVIRQIRSALQIAQRKSVPIIFSSGSSKISQMRSPRELISLAQILLGTAVLPLDSLSKIPLKLLKQNLIKVTPDYIVPGIFKMDNQSQSVINHTEDEEE